jgi:glycosyltransferase involved in cell wall biosynthesis
MITFSILIPCFQRAHLLPHAVDSALAQPADGVEIVIVNDGSTDGTHEVAMGYVTRHPDRVRLVDQPNRGVTLARAAGFAIATGNFLVFLDSDDLLEPGMIEACRRAVARRPDADLLVGNAWLEGAFTVRMPVDQAVVASWPSCLDDNPYGHTVAVVPRADAVRRVGGLAVGDLPTCEDFDLWVRMLRCGMIVEPLTERLGCHRVGAGGLSQDPLLMLEGRLRVLDRCAAPDPRLASAGPPGSPIPRAAYARLRNGAVFNALGLGLALGSEATAIAAILERLVGGAFDPAYCMSQFARGAEHARLGGQRTHPIRHVPRRAINDALDARGLPRFPAALAGRAHLALNPRQDPRALWGTLRWRVGRLAHRILSARA